MKIRELYEARRKEVELPDPTTYAEFEARANDRHPWIAYFDDGSIECGWKKMKSLQGAPRKVKGSFDCQRSHLTSLEFSPRQVGGDFHAEYNKLTNLHGSPQKIGGCLYLTDCGLTSLEGITPIIGGSLMATDNKLTNLHNIHKQLKSIGKQTKNKWGDHASADFNRNPIKSHVLGLLLVNGLKYVDLTNRDVMAILNKYLTGEVERDVLACQEELLEAGFDEYAQL